MTDMKCPICQTVLDKALLSDKVRGCPKCKNIGNIDLWQELIRTRKALDVAVDALKRIDWCAQDYAIAQEALDEITALEQKDK